MASAPRQARWQLLEKAKTMSTSRASSLERRATSLEAPQSDGCAVPGPRGRKTQLSPKVQQIILHAVEAGTSLEAAARSAGVSPHTVREWRRRGRGEDDRPAIEPYVSFAARLDNAQAGFEIDAASTIYAACQDGKWRAAAWLLERRYPQRWGRRSQRAGATSRQRDEVSHAPPRAMPPAAALERGGEQKLIEARALEEER